MSKYKAGQFVETKELGKVLVSKIGDNGEIIEVQKFDTGEKEPITYRVEDLVNKAITVLGFFKALWLQVVGFWKRLKSNSIAAT